jgi:hypothetical protein
MRFHDQPAMQQGHQRLQLAIPATGHYHCHQLAPQVNSISQEQPVTGINCTAGQNYTFAATSPVVASGKLL